MYYVHIDTTAVAVAAAAVAGTITFNRTRCVLDRIDSHGREKK